jgi:hypothetical protein
MKDKSITIGDQVTLSVLPPWIDKLSDESQAIFRYCVGRTFRVIEIDQNDHLILDVKNEIDKIFGGYMNDIRVEKEYVVKEELQK